MSAPDTMEGAREAVGIFHDADIFQAAVDDLLSAGFHRAELSFLASEHAVEEKLGHRYRRSGALADDPAVPRIAYVSTEAVGDAEGALVGTLLFVGATVATGAVVASGGTLAAAIVAAAAAGGTGGLIGSILAKWVGNLHARYLHEQLEHGGLLLWVRTSTPADEQRALEILRRHAADCVHLRGTATALPATA